jgi:hypothetical protein
MREGRDLDRETKLRDLENRVRDLEEVEEQRTKR